MAKYRAKALLFVGRLIAAGETFTSSAVPGRNWEPLDDAAKAAVAERDPSRAPVEAAADKLDARKIEPATVVIPADWPTLSAAKRRGIASKLGAPNTATADEANNFIKAELERRAAQQNA